MNLAHYLETSAKNFPGKAAVRHEGEIITYADLNAECDSLAAGLQNLGLAAGKTDQADFLDFESVCMPNAAFSSYPATPDDTLNILYTSGTTGRSKGVMLTDGNLASEARILANMRGKLEAGAVVVGVLPLYHVYGITSVLNVSFYQGLTVELLTQFDPKTVINITEEEEQTILFAVPTMYNRLIQSAGEAPPKRSSLKFCVSGGASLPVEFIHQFETLFSTKIYEGYGLTEAPVCEELIYQIPEIMEVAVIGKPHADLGEEVMALVVLKDGAEIEEDDIRDFVKQHVAPYKYPRVIQIRKEPLPKSGTGKILKKEIRSSID
jgi:acyl-CoA synthetase (AMP-forming)/AMP-acid ligase II